MPDPITNQLAVTQQQAELLKRYGVTVEETDGKLYAKGDAAQISAFLATQQAPKIEIDINGDGNVDATFEDLNNDQTKKQLERFLIRHGFTDEQVDQILAEQDPQRINEILQTGLDKHNKLNRHVRADGLLIMDNDRYAKLDNFVEQKKLTDDKFIDVLKTKFPQSKFPELYKKDGTLNERKAWAKMEDEFFFEQITGKSTEARKAEFKAQNPNMSDAEIERHIQAQNASFLKQDAYVQNKLMNNRGDTNALSEAEQEFAKARDNAHLFIKDSKKLHKNIVKCTERINNAIDRMNKWDWNKDLTEEQRTKIRAAVERYNQNQQANGGTPIKMFDNNGNLINKNLLYQFILDHVTGTDGQVNKSAKKGNFFQKLFSKRNVEFSEKKASRDLGLNKKDIENMGFDWENQISLGRVLLDGVEGATLGAIFGALVSDSDHDAAHDERTATARVDGQTLTGEEAYSGTVDYKVNGEVVMQIPYNGVVSWMREVAGDVVSETATADAVADAKVSAVLPSVLIAGTTAMVRSAIDQGINGQEKDIYNNNLHQVLSTRGVADLHSGEDVARLSGLDPEKNRREFNLARDIAQYYFDPKTGEFDKTAFITDWAYNGAYDSKYLNTQEAAMWLDKLRHEGPTTGPQAKIKVDIPPEITRMITHDIQGNGQLFETFHSGDPQHPIPILKFDELPEGYQVLGGAQYNAVGADGEARDFRTMTRNGIPTDITMDQQLANANRNRAQYVVAHNPDGTKIIINPREIPGESEDDYTRLDFDTPATIQLNDKTTGTEHQFNYRLLTDEELAQYPSLANETGPFYILTEAVDVQGRSILNPNAHPEIYQLNLQPKGSQYRVIQLPDGSFCEVEIKVNDYKMVQPNANFPGFGTSSVNNRLFPPFNR